MSDEKQAAVIEEKPVALKKITDAVPGSVVTDEHIEETTLEAENKKKEVDKDKKKPSLEADPENLVTTDPQENMEGPISSIMQDIKEAGEANDDESKEEADKKKDTNT